MFYSCFTAVLQLVDILMWSKKNKAKNLPSEGAGGAELEGIGSFDARSPQIQAMYPPKQRKCYQFKTWQNLSGFGFHFKLDM